MAGLVGRQRQAQAGTGRHRQAQAGTGRHRLAGRHRQAQAGVRGGNGSLQFAGPDAWGVSSEQESSALAILQALVSSQSA